MITSYANISDNYNPNTSGYIVWNFISLAAFWLMFQSYRKQRRDAAILIDEKSITASDYTIKVKNFPRPA